MHWMKEKLMERIWKQDMKSSFLEYRYERKEAGSQKGHYSLSILKKQKEKRSVKKERINILGKDLGFLLARILPMWEGRQVSSSLSQQRRKKWMQGQRFTDVEQWRQRCTLLKHSFTDLPQYEQFKLIRELYYRQCCIICCYNLLNPSFLTLQT